MQLEMTRFALNEKAKAMNPQTTQMLNSMLVPGILIVSAAILLFSTNSKYSLIVNRIRFLKEEKGKLPSSEKTEKQRANLLSNIELQLHHLIHRISLVRVIIVSYSSAMLFFVVAAILTSIRQNPQIDGFFWVSMGFVFGGLLGVVNGVVFSVIEMFKGYRIVKIEISEM